MRPRQIYRGHGERQYVEGKDRSAAAPGYDDGAALPASVIRSRL